MVVIRRRTELVQRYPYFDWRETLPVKAPRPLKEVEQMFRELPPMSLQRKVARARTHHVNVRVMLNDRRTMRDFFQAFAAHVQVERASRAVLKLMQDKQTLRTNRWAFDGIVMNWKKTLFESHEPQQIATINADIAAWMKHFFRERARQRQLLKKIPYS
jgi:hypothetical protein